MRFNIAAAIIVLGTSVPKLMVSALSAQTTFTPASRAVDVTAYTWVEQCIAASDRVSDSVKHWGPILYDTLMWNIPTKIPESVKIARHCSGKFPATTASLVDFKALLQLYQRADLPDEIVILLRRQIASIPSTDIAGQFSLLGVAAGNMVASGPAWFHFADSLHIEQMRIAQHPQFAEVYHDSIFVSSITFYNYLRETAKEYRDSIWTARAARAVAQLAEDASERELRLPFYERYGKYYVFDALTDLQVGASFDSLRKSSSAYVALLRSNWAKATHDTGKVLEFPLGETAPPLEGTFWFGRNDTTLRRPTPGKVGLIVFMDDFVDTDGGFSPQAWCHNMCQDAVATIKRLARRFPSLEVTLLARTRGFFRDLAPPSPREEAEWLNRYFLVYQNIPGALGVEQTEFWRLDAPDLRRVDQITPNFVHYGELGHKLDIKRGLAFLVDKSGIIIEMTRGVSLFGGLSTAPINAKREDQLARLIEILLSR